MATKKFGLTKSKIREITTKVDSDIQELNNNLTNLSKTIEEMQTQKIWIGGKRSTAWYNNMAQNITNSNKINQKIANLNNVIRTSVTKADELW